MGDSKFTDNSINIDGIEVYSNSIYSAIDSYILENNNIDLAKDVTQYQWKSVLYYIHDLVFPNRDMLKRKDKINNAYDYDLLEDIYNIYKRICVKYNKITCLADYCILTGIDDRIICTWSNDRSVKGFNLRGSEIHRKIMLDNESAISTQMISTGRNPVGFMAILNHYHGWATTAAAHGVEPERKTPQEIAAAHGVAISERQEPVPLPDFANVCTDETGENQDIVFESLQ